MEGKRILVVDDEPMVRDSLELMLKLDRHTVDLAASGAEALERFAQTKYDLILTDNRMPGMTGLQLAQELKTRNPAQLVILFTGSPPVEAGAWCDLVLVKPFSASQLRAVVDRLTQHTNPSPP